MGKSGLLVAGALIALAGCEDGGGLDSRPPQLDVIPQALDLDAVYLGGQAQADILISNPGKGPLRLGTPVLQGGEFSIANVRQIVAAGTDTRITVIYAPTQVGLSQSILRIPTNISDDVVIEVVLTGQGQAPLDCNDNNPCTADTFEANAGTCGYAPVDRDCDDGSACTDNDRCVIGECIGRAIQCDDGVECTRDLCDPATGCVTIGDDSKCVDTDPCTLDECQDSGCENPPAPDGHICGDVVACTTAEICVFRQCIEVAIPDGAPCDDKDSCTADDQCVAQSCTGTPISRPPIRIVSTTMVEGVSSGTLVGEHLLLIGAA